MRSVYRFRRGEPSGATLSLMLDAGASAGVATLGLIQQRRRSTSSRVARALEALAPFHLTSESVTVWKGSELAAGYSATRHTFQFDDETATTFADIASSIIEWENPQLLDDPHLLRADGSVWFGYTGCDQYAWLELSADEFEELRASHPDLASALRFDPNSRAYS